MAIVVQSPRDLFPFWRVEYWFMGLRSVRTHSPSEYRTIEDLAQDYGFDPEIHRRDRDRY